MKSPNYFFMIVTSLILLGCSPDNNTKTKLFEEERSTLEKAKAVESTIQQQTQQLQQNTEKQTQ